ncbi:MAG TPA: AIR synthase related protein [Mycobacterium sp.]|nr:AIR synthase related protein [Mycobacterium sp.]
MTSPHGTIDLDALARVLRDNPALRAKRAITAVAEVFGGDDWLGGPGDDGAVVAVGAERAEVDVVACGEALLPAFVAADPYGAGLAAVLTNVNDLAAMGAVPTAIVDTVVATEPVAREVLRGLRDGSAMYRVPLVGGHLTIHDGTPALSAFGLGWTPRALSVTRAAPSQVLLVACCTQGRMRPDFPFFRSFTERGDRLADDVRVLASVAESGACAAAKDVSMAGLIGSLAMLLEYGRLGVTVDLDAVPCPPDVALETWLMCFPAFAFLLCAPPERAAECAAAFSSRGLAVAAVGELDDSGVLSIRQRDRRAAVLDLRDEIVTGLHR